MNEIQRLNEEFNKLFALNEMAMAWTDRDAGRCVWVENTNTHNNQYFKYLNSFSYQKADKVVRISLRLPKYLVHKDSMGKQSWILNSKEKKELIDLMNSASKARIGFTNWQATLIQYNFDNFYIQPSETIEGTFDKAEFPDAFPIDFPMPDYTKLGE